MSHYVFVSADFPNVNSEQREKIYECLRKKYWTKVTCVGKDISTTWQVSFQDSASYAGMKQTIISDCESCYKEATGRFSSEARLAFQIANNTHETHNC